MWARLLKSLLLRAGVLQDGRIRPTNGGSLSRLALCAPTLVTTSQHFSGGVRFLSSAETQRHQNFKESTSLTDSTLTRKKKKTPHRPNRLNPADQSPGSVWHRGEERGNAASGPGSKQSSWAGSSYVALCLQLLDYEQDLWPLTCDEHITSSTYGCGVTLIQSPWKCCGFRTVRHWKYSAVYTKSNSTTVHCSWSTVVNFYFLRILFIIWKTLYFKKKYSRNHVFHNTDLDFWHDSL